MLAEIYGWFIEGFDTADLQEAKVLLTEFEGQGPGRQGGQQAPGRKTLSKATTRKSK